MLYLTAIFSVPLVRVHSENVSRPFSKPLSAMEQCHLHSSWTTENADLIIPKVDDKTPPKGVYCPLDQTEEVPQVPIGTCYKLTATEMENCQNMARERYDKNIAKKTKDMRYSREDGYVIDYRGICGELAFCRLFRRPIEIFDTTCRNVTNDTFDARMPNGWTVDVKTTIYEDADLLVLPNKICNPPTLYAFMIKVNDGHIVDPANETYSFRGFILADDLFQRHNLEKKGRYQNDGLHYRAYASELKEWEGLFVQ